MANTAAIIIEKCYIQSATAPHTYALTKTT